MPIIVEKKPFPEIISLTLTNACNLKCRMCGQWGLTGYLKKERPQPRTLPLSAWKKVIDEVHKHKGNVILIRGGEPFLYPDLIPLLGYIKNKGMFISIDTNGTLLEKFAGDLVRIGLDHLNISLDGTPAVHNRIRGRNDAYDLLKKGVRTIIEARDRAGSQKPRFNCCFTIGPDSYMSLPGVPDVLRDLGIPSLAIVPYYFFDSEAGERYEKVMKESFQSEGFSWKGFHREKSGVNVRKFAEAYRKFLSNLGHIQLIPFMDFTGSDYKAWFSDCTSQVGIQECHNPLKLMDIQPDGSVNFCVDYPDYVIGNITERPVLEIWNGERAETFRQFRLSRLLPVCLRCGAKYMSV
jgi:MoaA/NifB/PqqE/SkfB family radical SAM enzyme